MMYSQTVFAGDIFLSLNFRGAHVDLTTLTLPRIVGKKNLILQQCLEALKICLDNTSLVFKAVMLNLIQHLVRSTQNSYEKVEK